MQLVRFVAALVAARATASVAAGWAFAHGPPGLLAGTFSPDVAGKVAASIANTSSGYVGHVGAKGNARRSGGGGGPAPVRGWGTFSQIIDHDNPRLGTFSQRFWYSTEYWKGPGSPVILVNPGEQSGSGWNRTYLTNQRITGLFAEAVGGAIVILEHRYWGESAPYADLTVAHLRHLTVDNALRDMTYFARAFAPPFDPSGRSGPDRAPWVLAGGSYPGALAGWAAHLAAREPEAGGRPGHRTSPFWAYYATSGVVEAIGDFWQYFAMVQRATAANCSADLVATIAHTDAILLHGTGEAKAALKAQFLLEDLADADFAKALAFGPIVFQQTQFFLEPLYGYSPFYLFCDYIENMWPNSPNTAPGPGGVGVAKALDGYAKWFREIVLPNPLGYADFQGLYNTGCLQNLNASSAMYQDLSPGNAVSRQYWWLMCNEPIAWFQNTRADGVPSIVSRLVDYNYHVAICDVQFPRSAGGYGLARGRTPAAVNAATGGWSVPPGATPRLLYANGELDPWRAATVSSDWRPGGPLASTAGVPVHIVPGGGHCSDVYAENWAVNAGAKAVADAQAAILLGWVHDFYRIKGIPKPA